MGGGVRILQHVTSAWEVAGLIHGRMAEGEEVQLTYITIVAISVLKHSDTLFRRAVYFIILRFYCCWVFFQLQEQRQHYLVQNMGARDKVECVAKNSLIKYGIVITHM